MAKCKALTGSAVKGLKHVKIGDDRMLMFMTTVLRIDRI